MKRRTFLKSCAAAGFMGLCPSELFAESINLGVIHSKPVMPSVIIAKAIAKTATQMKFFRFNSDITKECKIYMGSINLVNALNAKDYDMGFVSFLSNGPSSLLCKNKSIYNIKQLSQKTLLVAQNNEMPNLVLSTLLKHYGVELKNIIFVPDAKSAAQEFIKNDEIDVTYLVEPVTSNCIVKARQMQKSVHRGINLISLWEDTFSNTLYQAALVVNRAYFNSKIEDFAKFHTLLEDAILWSKINNNSAVEFASNLLNMDEIVVQKALKHSNLCAVKASHAQWQINNFSEILREYNPKQVKNFNQDLFLL